LAVVDAAEVVRNRLLRFHGRQVRPAERYDQRRPAALCGDKLVPGLYEGPVALWIRRPERHAQRRTRRAVADPFLDRTVKADAGSADLLVLVLVGFAVPEREREGHGVDVGARQRRSSEQQ